MRETLPMVAAIICLGSGCGFLLGLDGDPKVLGDGDGGDGDGDGDGGGDGDGDGGEVQLFPSEPVSDGGFGSSISIDGDTVAMGSNPKIDVVHVFERTGPSWNLQPVIVPDDDSSISSNNFGWSVSLSGATLLVAAIGDDDGGENAGAAYVFERSNDGWAQQAKIVAADASPGDSLGNVVALDGDTALISAASGLDGCVYIVVRSGTTWSEQAKICRPGVTSNLVGRMLAVDGDRALIGAPFDDELGADAGAAYMFERVGSTWTQNEKLFAADPESGSRFGSSVALDGDRAVVGVQFASGETTINSGAAYVFKRAGSRWEQAAKLVREVPADSERFGLAVGISSDRAVVSAHRTADESAPGGAVYAFLEGDGSWSQVAALQPPDSDENDAYGLSISLDGDTVAIGNPSYDVPGFNTGTAYIIRVP